MKRERLDRPTARQAVHNEAKKPLDRGFIKGGKKIAGRQKGTPNKLTFMIKEAMLEAIVRTGNGRGKQGAVEFFMELARQKDKTLIVRLLERCLPYQVTGKDGGPVQMVYETVEDVKQRMKERGLPVPKTLTAMPIYQPLEEDSDTAGEA